ncbi:S-layer homology domain-containing protein [Lawsonibacter celer]|uniref:S-layer homology domain-containing protein n=1 Tax=Lawsonibacter celer TaxID=2986526 RepID=UPI001645222C|nr:S-layer homology domain-containing protein [Lawsonibacter celer]
MRNLKRALSLVLAAAMLIGMMVVSAGAAGSNDFTDKDEIVNNEAVSVLVTLGVINGKEDGSYFDPTGIVTRAEMAKMITVALHGGKDPVLGVKDKPSFSDIKGHWAESYIEYCTSDAVGVISGRGNGTFDPNATVTAAEAAKMLLVAIGYKADVFKLTGGSWQINTDVYANQAKLYDGLNITSSAQLTRDNAAQMIWNGIQAAMMVRSWSQNQQTGQITEGYNLALNNDGTVAKSILTEKFGATITDSAVLKLVDLDNKGTYTLETSGTDANAKTKKDFAKVEGNYADLLGQNVRVVYKMVNGQTQVYGVFADETNNVIEANVNKIESVSSTEIKIDGAKYKLASSGLYTITDGVYAAGLSLAVAPTSFNTFKLIDNDGDNKYDGAVVTTVAAAKVTYASSTEIIAGGTTYKQADHNIADGIAKNDYVTIVYNIAEDKKDITEVSAISGAVDGVKTINTTSCVRVDGAWYAKNSETMNIDVTYKFYAVNGVVISGSVDASSADIANLIMVLATDTEMLTNKAMVMHADGTIETVTIDGAGVAAASGEMYTYTETDKGFKLAAAATIGSDYTWAADGTVAAGAGGKVATVNSNNVADDAVIFVKSTDGGKVITGKQFKNLASSILGAGNNQISTTASGSYTSVVNGLTRVSYAGVIFNGKAADLGVTSGNVNYAYVTSASYTVSSSYTTYTIWNGESNLTVIDKGATTVAKGDILTYDTIDGDYITGVSKISLTAPSMAGADGVAYVAGKEGDYLFLDGTADASNKYKVTSNTKYLYVDSNASKADEIGKDSGEVVLANKFGGSIYMDNVIAVVNTSGELELLVVDVKNNLTNSVNATLTAAAPTISNANVSLSKTTGIKAGDAIEVTITATGAVTTGSLTLTNAKAADGTASVTYPSLADGETYKFTVFADGVGAVSFT